MAWKLFGRNWLTGIICMWHGLLVDIPNGWALCDGNNGTPDLRNRFLRCVAPGVNPGGTAGGYAHTHRIHDETEEETDDHNHSIDFASQPMDEGGYDYDPVGSDHQEYGAHVHEILGSTDDGGQPHSHQIDFYSNASGVLPPYYFIAYIMKL